MNSKSRMDTSQVLTRLKHNHMILCRLDQNGGVWNLTLVILIINHATTFRKWSPLENKFAVDCEAQFISVCFLSMKMTSG